MNEIHIIQKSTPLLSLWNSELTLIEFKILDIYLSRINSHQPEHRSVMFSKGELERLLGVKRIRREELQKRLKHLMNNVVELRDVNNSSDFALITLFEEAQCIMGDNMQWQVELTCTQKAMKYFFNVENLGYLKYTLKNVINIDSRYSYILFIYLESNRKLHLTWSVDLTQLKQILNCDNESYNETKIFNNRILKKCQQELEEKTETRFTYEPIKVGRKITQIKFTLEPLRKKIENEDLKIVAEFEPDDENYFAACNGEFSEDEINELLKLIKPMFSESANKEKEQFEYLREKYNGIKDIDPFNRYEIIKKSIQSDFFHNKYDNDDLLLCASACDYAFDNNEIKIIFNMVKNIYPGNIIEQHSFIERKYLDMKCQEERKKIKNRFSYFKKSIENEQLKSSVS